MEWFSGSIPEAIQLAKNRESVFIVYVTGENEATKEMDKILEEEDIAQAVRQGAAVAIQIKAGSEACSFFSQIYPVVIVPSVYFIGHNGMPLEVLGSNMAADVFKEKVLSVLEKNRPSEASSAPEDQLKPAETAAASPKAEESDSGSAEAASSVSAAEDTQPISKGAEETEHDLNERLERAKQLIEQKRIQKAKEEEEKEREKEIERRKTGQNLQQLKQYQHDQELKEMKEQLRKEKEEQRKARERIKEQIEKDRADRSARYQKEKAEKEEQQEAARKAKLLEQQKAAAEAEARRSEIARIQFRLPDGSSVSNQFPSTSLLQEAANFISPIVGGNDVSLSTTFPRRTFSQADMATSFRDLQLAPTAVIMVIPITQSLTGSFGGGGGRLGGLWSLLLAPLLMLWKFLLSIFTFSPVAHNTNASSSNAKTSAAGGDRSKPSGAVKRFQQDGNVRRLGNTNDDDDDENATWNGNSTQQM